MLSSRTGPGKAAHLVGPRRRVAGGPKKEKKQKQKRDAGYRGRDRKGPVTRTTRRPEGTRTAWGAAQEYTAGAGGAQPVLGARNGPRMDENPVGPRHRVAGGLVGYKHGMREGMGPHNSPGGIGRGRGTGERGRGGKGTTRARRSKRSPDGRGSSGPAPHGCWLPGGV